MSDLLPLALTLVVAGMGVAFGLNIMGETKDDIGLQSCSSRTDGFTNYNATSDLCYNSSGSTLAPTTADFNSTNDSIAGVGKFSSKFGIIATVVVAAVVVGLLVRFLVVR